MPDTEEVTVILKEWDVEWKIDFSSFSEKVGEVKKSPPFMFEDESWYMVIWPNGCIPNQSTGYMDLRLRRKTFSRSPPIDMEISFSLKNVNGKKHFKRQATRDCDGWSWFYDNVRFLSKTEFNRRRSEFLSSSGFFTVVCTLKKLDPTEIASDISKSVSSHCEKSCDADEVSLHEKKRRGKCPDCSNIVLYENWHDHECETSGVEDVSSLSEDFKQMLLNGLNHDVILKVGDKELKAHQDVLRTRSQVFKSMLSHDMKEKNSGTIDIPDCDPQAMEQFLCFIYSGHVDKFEESNMLNLYYIADKYEVKELKEKCCAFIKKSLSNSNVCEIIQLALNHSDSNLLDHATQYFMDNALGIMCTVEWQSFMKNNCTVANELTIKAFKKLKNQNL